jgi:hypothetical protein
LREAKKSTKIMMVFYFLMVNPFTSRGYIELSRDEGTYEFWESAASNLAATTAGTGGESHSPPFSKIGKSQSMSKPAVPVPVRLFYHFI